MDEVGEAVLDFNKRCGKAEKALDDFDGRLQKRWTKARKIVEENYNRIVPEISSTSTNDVDKLKRLGRAMKELNELMVNSMENILRIEYKLTKVFADMCEAARKTRKSTFKCYKNLTIFFKEEMFATQKQAISELVAEVDRIATPWKTRTDETENLLVQMKKCRFVESDDFASKVRKFETMVGLYRGYEPVKIVKTKGKIISMKDRPSK